MRPGGRPLWLIGTTDGQVHGLNASGRSSASARVQDLTDRGLDGVPARSEYSVSVPGATDGWIKAHERFATMPLADLLVPASELAERGFHASRHAIASFRITDAELRAGGAYALRPDLEQGISLYQRIRQPDLATTLRDTGATRGRFFYEGASAQRIAEVVQARGGWLTTEDLAAHTTDWVDPISVPYRGHKVITMPPPTQGFAFLSALTFLERLAPRRPDWRTPATTHLMVEAVAAAQSKGDTAHFCVVDCNGLSVSLIQSIYYDFGSAVPVEGSGYVLQNRAAAFHLDTSMAGHPAPGVRPPSTLMSVLVQKDGRVSHVFACMGGDGQVQTNVQLALNLLDGRLDPQQAISRLRFVLHRAPQDGALLMMEAGLHDFCGPDLAALGHDVVRLGPAEEVMGHAQVIQRIGDVLVGGADPRSDGQVAGV